MLGNLKMTRPNFRVSSWQACAIYHVLLQQCNVPRLPCQEAAAFWASHTAKWKLLFLRPGTKIWTARISEASIEAKEKCETMFHFVGPKPTLISTKRWAIQLYRCHAPSVVFFMCNPCLLKNSMKNLSETQRSSGLRCCPKCLTWTVHFAVCLHKPRSERNLQPSNHISYWKCLPLKAANFMSSLFSKGKPYIYIKIHQPEWRAFLEGFTKLPSIFIVCYSKTSENNTKQWVFLEKQLFSSSNLCSFAHLVPHCMTLSLLASLSPPWQRQRRTSTQLPGVVVVRWRRSHPHPSLSTLVTNMKHDPNILDIEKSKSTQKTETIWLKHIWSIATANMATQECASLFIEHRHTMSHSFH